MAHSESGETQIFMRLERTGGFAGPIARPPVEIDLSALSQAEKAEAASLVGLIEESGIHDLPPTFPGTPFPDAMTSTLLVHGEGWEISVTFQEGDGHPGFLDTLAEWIWAHRRIS